MANKLIKYKQLKSEIQVKWYLSVNAKVAGRESHQDTRPVRPALGAALLWGQGQAHYGSYLLTGTSTASNFTLKKNFLLHRKSAIRLRLNTFND